MYDIEDDDIRIITSETSPDPSQGGGNRVCVQEGTRTQAETQTQTQTQTERMAVQRRRRIRWGRVIGLIALVLCMVGLLIYLPTHSKGEADLADSLNVVDQYFADSELLADSIPQKDVVACEPIAREDANTRVLYTSERIDTINDVVLRSLAPNATCVPELYMGDLDRFPGKLVLAAQAADIRADNNEIAGDFVFEGRVMAKGHPKKGFCAIVDGVIYMGCQTYTPYFEKAFNNDGFFFRQFSLVHEGQYGERTPKGKSIRRALCYKDNFVFIMETMEEESFHDFSQALIDYGVQEAIALVGSTAITKIKQADGTYQYNLTCKPKGKTSFIVWRE